ncbi:NUDIX domain-containing protein [Rothia sp. ZJ932]|uniref:NUDIX hydrolase n=1 Tax=Rothia sp. ZJ932 TaxID=2810516 RepID=UPI001F082361|nr:NUDIX domain-containing protein [Rothia sp. ZJ932]
MKIITVSAVVIVREDGWVLTVRKNGTTGFMMPGGKPEAGEDARTCALREVREELGLVLESHQLADLGVFEARALNEPDMTVRAHVFTVRGLTPGVLDTVQAAAEIAELKWVNPATERENQADLNLSHIFPALV